MRAKGFGRAKKRKTEYVWSRHYEPTRGDKERLTLPLVVKGKTIFTMPDTVVTYYDGKTIKPIPGLDAGLPQTFLDMAYEHAVTLEKQFEPPYYIAARLVDTEGQTHVDIDASPTWEEIVRWALRYADSLVYVPLEKSEFHTIDAEEIPELVKEHKLVMLWKGEDQVLPLKVIMGRVTQLIASEGLKGVVLIGNEDFLALLAKPHIAAERVKELRELVLSRMTMKQEV